MLVKSLATAKYDISYTIECLPTSLLQGLVGDPTYSFQWDNINWIATTITVRKKTRPNFDFPHHVSRIKSWYPSKKLFHMNLGLIGYTEFYYV